MKLLFLWIYCSKNGFIQKKGFNISGKFFWKYDEEKRILSAKKKDGYIKGFWNENNDNIEDLSVIVGTNGAGKSTLLSELMKYGIVVPPTMNGETNTQIKISDRKIVVYERDGRIYYDHNLGYEIKTCPAIVRKNIDALKDCTKIFVSNSMNNPVRSALYQEESVLDYALTDYTINDQARFIMNKNRIPDYMYATQEKDESRYYDDPSSHRSENKYIHRIYDLNYEIDKPYDGSREFNALIRLYFLVKSKCKNYAGKKYQFVLIKQNTRSDFFKDKELERRISSEDEIWKAIAKLECKEENFLLSCLIKYFLYEYKTYLNNGFWDIEEISIYQIERIAEFLQNIIDRNIEDSLQENMTISEYFLNAINDLKLLKNLVQEKKNICYVEGNDESAYNEVLRIDINRNQEFFNRLFMFFERGIPSIFMRYLTFEFEGMSSGEEAMLNLYSRIFWIYNAQKCKTESLILIDEIDLYMHPKWQRELISYLVEDIPNLIGEGNKAQIVITTHSPIILSDIPRANTIFLENKKGKCIVGINRAHRNTFGNNVHTLFLDSFFLTQEGTMGAFAENRINSILKLLRSKEKINDEDKKIFNTISCVGDDLIRNKLLELYEKNQRTQHQVKEKQTTEENRVIDNTIEMLKSQVGELLRTIEQLEQMKND